MGISTLSSDRSKHICWMNIELELSVRLRGLTWIWAATQENSSWNKLVVVPYLRDFNFDSRFKGGLYQIFDVTGSTNHYVVNGYAMCSLPWVYTIL